jgi:transposase
MVVQGDVLMLDNLGARRASRVEEVADGRGTQVLCLPPYSPDYSPVEQYWSKVKGLPARGEGAHASE